MTNGHNDYYQKEFTAYHQETFSVDPAPFLTPLTDRLPAPAHILDIGCGSGRDLRWFCERGYSGTGFEGSQGLAELARRNSGCPIIEGDFSGYDFSSLPADGILLIGALVHLGHDIFKDVLSNCLQALHGNGLVLITLKEGDGTRTDQRGRLFHLWHHEDVMKIFHNLGLTLVDFSRNVSQIRPDDIWLGYLLSLDNIQKSSEQKDLSR
ncbi:class I SAM-dependent methyltransferase [Thermodesulfobacteriota bacterium]